MRRWRPSGEAARPARPRTTRGRAGGPLRSPNYHEETDTLETLDFGFMTNVTRATAAYAAERVHLAARARGPRRESSSPLDGDWDVVELRGIEPLTS
jgi:hypothetical protein